MDGGCAWPNSSTACSSGTSPVRSSRTPSTRSSGTCVERCDRPAGPAGPSGPGRRRARLLRMLVLAAARLVAGLGAALQAQGDHIDAVLLFSAFSLIMIGIVCALAAIIAWTRLNRDVLDSVAAAPPARARAPRTRTAGMVVAIGFAVLGALFAILLWDRTPI